VDDRQNPLARLRSAQALSFTHFADDRGVLQDACRQLRLAEAVLAVEVLAQEIAKPVAHVSSQYPHQTVRSKVSTFWTIKGLELDIC
jgi:hypothetical protein